MGNKLQNIHPCCYHITFDQIYDIIWFVWVITGYLVHYMLSLVSHYIWPDLWHHMICERNHRISSTSYVITVITLQLNIFMTSYGLWEHHRTCSTSYVNIVITLYWPDLWHNTVCESNHRISSTSYGIIVITLHLTRFVTSYDLWEQSQDI